MKNLFIYFICIISFSKLTSMEYTFSICSVIEENTKQLEEWITYHENLGVDHFFLYYSTKNNPTIDKLQTSPKSQKIDFIFWPKINANLQNISVTKMTAYENARQYRAIEKTQWLVFLNTNEFLSPNNSSIEVLLKKYQDYTGIILPCSYYKETAAHALYLPTKTEKKETEKTIFQPKKITKALLSPYRPYEQKKTQFPTLSKKECCIRAYYPEKNSRFNRSPIPCNPIEIADEDIEQALQLGYELVDITQLPKNFSKK